jgi:predicted O-methyltransferase YrrM
MPLYSRVMRYALAGFTIGRLKRSVGHVNSEFETLVNQTCSFANGFIEPFQVRGEIVLLARDVSALAPRNVLEIGTAKGGTLFIWTRVSDPSARIVSVDLPGGRFGGGYSRFRSSIYRRFGFPQQNIHLLRGDSHSLETLERVKRLFGGQPIDFLFIDGDHTYQGVRHDWQAYAGLVRPGGMIAFHDVARSYGDTQVERLWNEIKDEFDYTEYALHPEGLCGIGIIRKPLPPYSTPIRQRRSTETEQTMGQV